MINGALIDIKRYLENIGTPENIIENINNNVFSEVFIKKMSNSNVLDSKKKDVKENGETNNQTHIDITGPSMWFFILEEEKARYNNGAEIKKEIYLRLIKNNIDHLIDIEDTVEGIEFINKGSKYTPKKRKEYNINTNSQFRYLYAQGLVKVGHGSNPQVQINTPEQSDEFHKLRKLVYKDDVLVFLKYRNFENEYLVLVIPSEEVINMHSESALSKSGNNVYKIGNIKNEYMEEDYSSDKNYYRVKYEGITIFEDLGMTETPYNIVQHYIKNNNLPFKTMKEKFEVVGDTISKSQKLEFILEEDEIGGTGYKREKNYFTKVRPLLSHRYDNDITKLGVLTQWYNRGRNKNFDKFIESIKELGYTVETQYNRSKLVQEDTTEYGATRNIKKGAINKIYFGAPGTGKSNYVDKTYYDDFAKRVTFHPEYTYNDFLGYIRPVVDGDDLTYKFVPGTFTEILVEALDDPYNMYTLIVEELNRANTAAVFGDLFQLLDRKSDGSSQYRVNNTDIYKHIKDKMGSNYEYNDGSIGIPSNLNIIATMNTVDQNVFVMDTAFKRRWEFEYIPVKFDDDHEFKDNKILNLNISWKEFVTVINEFMMSRENEDLMISEDKQIGPYFVKSDELMNSKKFGYKVLLYLWDDVFKMDRYKIFNEDIRTFSSLIDKFSSENALDIFKSNISEQLKTKNTDKA